MRIILLSGGLENIGGIESFVLRLSEDLTIAGHEMVLITLDIGRREVPFNYVEIKGFISGGSDELLRRAEAEVLEYIRGFKPDVVLSQTIHNGRLLLSINSIYPTAEFLHVFLCNGGKLFRGTDTVCTQPIGPKCLINWYAGPCGNDKSIVKAVSSYKQASTHLAAVKRLPSVLVLSNYMKSYLINEGLRSDQVHVVNNLSGVPAERKTVARSLPRRNLLFVGRVVYNKGVQYVVKALQHLPTEVNLTVVGDGWYLNEVKKLVSELGLDSRVKFTGFLSGNALEAEYTRADIAVVPSIWPEPGGLVVPEARGRGLPVVCFDVGGLGDWSKQFGYSDVYLSETVSVEALTKAIELARFADGTMPANTSSVQPVEVAVALEMTIDAWNQGHARNLFSPEHTVQETKND